MVKSVNTRDLKSLANRLVGSIPTGSMMCQGSMSVARVRVKRKRAVEPAKTV